MPVAAIVPIRSFEHGKGRLSPDLHPDQRTRLAMGMAQRTVTAAELALLLPVIVTAADEVRTWAVDLGLLVIPETSAGLDSAARVGAAWAASNGMSWAVIHSDLPLVTAADLSDLGALANSGRDVIAPSADGGTTAISSAGAVEFAYGPGSFHRHLSQLDRPAVLARVGTLHDLDSLNDLHAAMDHPEGAWLAQVAASSDDSAPDGKEI